VRWCMRVDAKLSAAEGEKIRRVVGDLIAGIQEGDAGRLLSSLHPSAVCACALGPEPVVWSIGNSLKLRTAVWPAPLTGEYRPGYTYTTSFIGPRMAVVKLRCSLKPEKYTDVLTLLKVDGEWRVVARAFQYQLASRNLRPEPLGLSQTPQPA
jgi:Putative lumazine-binding